MNKPFYQVLIERIIWTLVGVSFLGGLLDAISNAYSFFNFTVVLIISILIGMAYLVLIYLSRMKKIFWISNNGNVLRIINLSIKLKYGILGVLLLLWVPAIINNEEKKIVESKPAQHTNSLEKKGEILAHNKKIGRNINMSTMTSQKNILGPEIKENTLDISIKPKCKSTEEYLFVENLGRALTEETSKKVASINIKSEMINAFYQQIETTTESFVKQEMQNTKTEEQITFKETIKETKIGSLTGFLIDNVDYTYDKNESGQKITICHLCAKIPIQSNFLLFINELKNNRKIPQNFDYDSFLNRLLTDYKISIK